MLRPAGPDLARRWLAALLLVSPEDREAVVSAVERRVTDLYSDTAPAGHDSHDAHDIHDPEVRVVHPAQQREGYVEQVETTYGVEKPKPAAAKPRKKRRA